MAHGRRCAWSLRHDLNPNIFRPTLPLSQQVHIFACWNLPFPIFYTFQALIQTDLKEKLFKALMLAVLCFFIFLERVSNFCKGGVALSQD